MEQIIIVVLAVAVVKLYQLSALYAGSRWAPGIRITLLLCIVGLVVVTVSQAAKP